MLDYQSKGRVDPLLLQSFGWEFQLNSHLLGKTVYQIHTLTFHIFFFFIKNISMLDVMCTRSSSSLAELQIRGCIEDNSKIIFLISHRKHML